MPGAELSEAWGHEWNAFRPQRPHRCAWPGDGSKQKQEVIPTLDFKYSGCGLGVRNISIPESLLKAQDL